MHSYGKIDTLYNRDENFRVTVGDFRRPIFRDISEWFVTEKVDGNNIRIEFAKTHATSRHAIKGVTLEVVATQFKIAGKSDNASIHPGLLEHCTEVAKRALPILSEAMSIRGLTTITLFGEGYGEKIQSGGYYRTGQGFILFDVMADDKFLSWDVMCDYAADLDIPHVPMLGIMGHLQITELVSAGVVSSVAQVERGRAAEGIVARPREVLYDNRGELIRFKLKARDFRGGKH